MVFPFYLVPAAAMLEPVPAMTLDLETRIINLAANSDLAVYNWRGRGKAPLGYTKGMAVAFSRVYQQWKLGVPATMIMGMANTHESATDALSWYEGVFVMRDMNNDEAGIDTLRHLFVLMMGLGMRESSGRFCEGRDRSAGNTSSDTAEAGLFQMSWDAHTANREITHQFNRYLDPDDELARIFHEGVTCSEQDLENYGSGDGRLFQEACKANPMCAIMTTGVGLRVLRRHWGPINRHEAEVRPEANELFKQVQSMVDDESLVAQAE